MGVVKSTLGVVHKLLLVTTTASAICKGQGARCKGYDHHPCKSERDAEIHATPTTTTITTTTDQLRISTGAGEVHNAAVIATCIRVGHGRNLNCVPLYTICNDCCIVHFIGTNADPELVGGGSGWSCMLLLHPAPTCADRCWS